MDGGQPEPLELPLEELEAASVGSCGRESARGACAEESAADCAGHGAGRVELLEAACCCSVTRLGDSTDDMLFADWPR